MILGTMAEVSGPYGMETSCLPLEGADLAEQLEDAVVKIHGTMVPAVERQKTELDEIMERYSCGSGCPELQFYCGG